MRVVKEFKLFILRGNAIDLAVGVVMGAAFGGVVTSLVQGIVTPMIKASGSDEVGALPVRIGSVVLEFGPFVNAAISLLMTGLVIFFLVLKPVNKLMDLRKTEPDVESPTVECPHCLSSIPRKATRCAFCTSEVNAGSSVLGQNGS